MLCRTDNEVTSVKTKTVFRLLSIIMFALTLVLIIGAVTVSGAGFLDISNLARYALIGFAVIAGILGAVFARKGWK